MGTKSVPTMAFMTSPKPPTFGEAGFAVVSRVFHYQNGVLGAHAQQEDYADLRVNADALVHEQTSDYRTQDGHGHREDHGYGGGPAFILRRQHQKGLD